MPQIAGCASQARTVKVGGATLPRCLVEAEVQVGDQARDAPVWSPDCCRNNATTNVGNWSVLDCARCHGRGNRLGDIRDSPVGECSFRWIGIGYQGQLISALPHTAGSAAPQAHVRLPRANRPDRHLRDTHEATAKGTCRPSAQSLTTERVVVPSSSAPAVHGAVPW